MRQTNLADWSKDTPEGREAGAFLRKCVHCGFCLATCPTYNLLGDELDSPRGRIYLMKQAMEGGPVTVKTQVHLDRCLTCRACETTCPSGVQYGRLVDIGREVVEKRVPRELADSAFRRFLRFAFLSGPLFSIGVSLGRLVRPLLPEALARQVPPKREVGPWPAARHSRRMLVLDGCVQPTLAPDINAATARVLGRLGISLVTAPKGGCCGAIDYHLNAQAEALDRIRRQIDAWWPEVEAGAEAVVITASGCGTMVHEYGHLLRGDPAYAAKAARISGIAKDVGEVVAGERDALKKLLAGVLDGDLPAEVATRLESFDAAAFALDAAIEPFVDDSPELKRKLLELVAAVRDADEIVDLEEDAYVTRVAGMLGVAKAAYADLVLDLEVEELTEVAETVARGKT